MSDRSLSYITHWRNYVPWANDSQVEQDLVISRALIDIFNHPILTEQLAFRGGTALQKCFFKNPKRYSEDIDLVQTKEGPIGKILDAFKTCLEPWLGEPIKKKFGPDQVTIFYHFNTVSLPSRKMKLKVEINTREHFTVMGYNKLDFLMQSPWYENTTKLITYELEELLGAKLRALYQRKKGRDLFDLATALKETSFDIKQMIHCFTEYTTRSGVKISRKNFEQNLIKKQTIPSFREDIMPLLSTEQKTYDFEENFNLIWDKIIVRLPD